MTNYAFDTSFPLRGFELFADWARDDNYAHSKKAITIWALAYEWRVGMQQAYQEVAPPARLMITLDNSDGAWNIENSSARFYGLFTRDVRIRFRVAWVNGDEIDGAPFTEFNRFLGTIRHIEVGVGTLGEKIATLTVEDPMLDLLDNEYHPQLQTDVTTDVALAAIFDDPEALAYPYPHNYWMLGIAGASELGVTTQLFDHDITDFETGRTTLDYVGHNADVGQGINAQSLIRTIVASEAGGKFFWDARQSRFRFWDRYYSQGLDTSSVLDLSPYILQDTPPVYVYAEELLNQVEISYEETELGTPGSVLWQQSTPVSISAGQTRQFTARYRDPDVTSARVGGINMIAPVAVTDYTANTQSDGGGSDVTSSIGVSVQFSAMSAKVSVANPTDATAYLTACQIRGQPLTTYTRSTATALDGDSIYANGLFFGARNLPLVQDAEFAQDYALSIVSHFKDPIGRFERVTIDMRRVPKEVLALDIGDVVSISDPQLDNAVTLYLIVGEEGRVSGGNTWDCTFVLEPFRRQTFWVLDQVGGSELGETTILAL